MESLREWGKMTPSLERKRDIKEKEEGRIKSYLLASEFSLFWRMGNKRWRVKDLLFGTGHS